MIGGLHSVPDVKILVLYILDYAGCTLSKKNLNDIVMGDGLVSYFDFTQSIEELLHSGLIDIARADTPDIFKITQSGRQMLAAFVKTLPFNVRKKNSAALLNLLAQIKREGQVVTETRPRPGGMQVRCTLKDGEDILLEYALLVPNALTASIIAEQFKENPTEKYKNILSLLVDDKLFADDEN